MKAGKYRKSVRKLLARARRRLFGGRRILIVGDSHSAVFEYVFDHDLFPPHYINCEITGGATAYGLNNDRSSTGAFAKFSGALEAHADYDVIIYMFGEVDCSFLLWQKAAESGRPAQELVARSLQGLARLLGVARANCKGARHVLAGAILPTIKDHQRELQDVELRRQIDATQRQRTDLVLHYNAALAELARQQDCDYIDITAATLDPASELLADAFLMPDVIDIHQSAAATWPLWIGELQKVIAEIERDSSR